MFSQYTIRNFLLKNVNLPMPLLSKCFADDALQKQYIPRRVVLYVPGNDKRKLDKIANLEADCVVMDCEDGVAANQKEAARQTIYEYLQSSKENFNGKDCSVRLNGIGSGLFESDIKAIVKGPVLPTTLFLPKVENANHIKIFSDKLQQLLKNRNLEEKIRLVVYMESASSLLSLPYIFQQALDLSAKSPFVLDGVVFGSDDFCADIGATRTSHAREVLFARQYTVAVAKAYKLQAIDAVYIDYKDLEGLRSQSLEGAEFGYTGKQVIHPDQIDVVQSAFSPSKEKIQWATELVEAFEKHQSEGKGAFTFKGNMIDKPLLLQATNILITAKRIS